MTTNLTKLREIVYAANEELWVFQQIWSRVCIPYQTRGSLGLPGKVICTLKHAASGNDGADGDSIAALHNLSKAILSVLEAAAEVEEECVCRKELNNPRVDECGTCMAVHNLAYEMEVLFNNDNSNNNNNNNNNNNRTATRTD